MAQLFFCEGDFSILIVLFETIAFLKPYTFTAKFFQNSLSRERTPSSRVLISHNMKRSTVQQSHIGVYIQPGRETMVSVCDNRIEYSHLAARQSTAHSINHIFMYISCKSLEYHLLLIRSSNGVQVLSYLCLSPCTHTKLTTSSENKNTQNMRAISAENIQHL